MTEQLRYISQYDSIIGSSWFSYKTLNSFNSNVVQSLERIQEHYWTTYPSFPWESDVVKVVDVPTFEVSGDAIVENVYDSMVTITFTSEDDVYYKINDGQWMLFTNDLEIDEIGNYQISYKAVDEDGNESVVETIIFEMINPVTTPVPTLAGDHLSGNTYEDRVNLTFSADDSIYYKIDNGQWKL